MPLLILLTFIIFIRPTEWVPGMVGMQLYLFTILLCLVIYGEAWTRQLSQRSLLEFPINACVVGLLIMVAVSEVLNRGSLSSTDGFLRNILFYFLLVGIIDTDKKLSIYLKSLAVILCAMGLLIHASSTGLLNIQMAEPLDWDSSPAAGRYGGRLGSLSSNFSDPNDTAMLLAVGILLAFHYAIDRRSWILRALWLGIAAAMVPIMQLTDSRGGFLALMVGLGIYVVIRWRKKGLIFGACLMPLVVGLIATDRMSGIGSAVQDDTGQLRLQFWLDALVMFTRNPVFGSGPGGFNMHVGKAAHNTFLQGFAELGFVGGMLFVGAFAYGLISMVRLARTCTDAADESSEWVVVGELDDAETGTRVDSTACLIAAVLGSYGMAILSLNHLTGACTYVILGLATATARVRGVPNTMSASTLLVRCIGVGIGFVLVSRVVGQYLVRY